MLNLAYMINCSLPLIVFMPNTEEEVFLLGVLPHGYFYQFSQYKIHQHSGNEIKFALKTRINVCWQENVNLNLSDFNDISSCSQTDTLQRLLWEQNSHKRL